MIKNCCHSNNKENEKIIASVLIDQILFLFRHYQHDYSPANYLHMTASCFFFLFICNYVDVYSPFLV